MQLTNKLVWAFRNASQYLSAIYQKDGVPMFDFGDDLAYAVGRTVRLNDDLITPLEAVDKSAGRRKSVLAKSAIAKTREVSASLKGEERLLRLQEIKLELEIAQQEIDREWEDRLAEKVDFRPHLVAVSRVKNKGRTIPASIWEGLDPILVHDLTDLDKPKKPEPEKKDKSDSAEG